jgi:small-conductance mechanosensitive channel
VAVVAAAAAEASGAAAAAAITPQLARALYMPGPASSNELLLSQRVENWSLDDRRILQTCTVVVDQAADVQQTMGLLTQVLGAQPQVLKDPAPVVLLAQVDQGGLGFTLNYWIDDLDQGQGNLKSDILVAVLASLRSQGVALAQAPAVALLTR